MKAILKLATFLLLIVILGFEGGYIFSAATYHQSAANIALNNSNTPNNDQSRTYQVPSFTPPSSSYGSEPGNVSTASQDINTSTNWAGYVASDGTYTSISGSWTAPDPSNSGNTSSDATWIGIGGVESTDLIQVGTQNIVTTNGQVETSAFYEMLPYTSQTISSLSVNPGDSISASLSQTASGIWTISITDNTIGSSYVTQVAYSSSLSSAEWIEEDPSDSFTQIPLDNFGSITFTNCLTTVNGNSLALSSSNAQAITMNNSDDQTLASVSAISNNGSFTVARTSATTVPAISQFNLFPGRWVRRGVGLYRY